MNGKKKSGSKKPHDKAMAAKTAKAHVMQAYEAGLIQHYGDCADSLTEKRLHWHKFVVNERPQKKPFNTVYRVDGTIIKIADLDAARNTMRMENAPMLWNAIKKVYECSVTKFPRISAGERERVYTTFLKEKGINFISYEDGNEVQFVII